MQFSQPLSFRDLQVDMQNCVNSNYRIGQSNRNYEGRNNDIFLAGGDALVYVAGPMHKKYSTTFVWGHPFSTYVS